MSRVLGRYSQASSRLLRRHSTPVHPRATCADAAAEVTPRITRAEYAARRAAVLSAMPSHSLALFPSASSQFMSEDVPHLYHQNTDLLYLTGCAEPGSALLLDTSPGASARSTLFVAPRDAEREAWDGPMHGVSERTRANFGVDAVAAAPALASAVGRALGGLRGARPRVFLDAGGGGEAGKLLGALAEGDARDAFRAAWAPHERPKQFVARARLVKSPAEVALLRDACSAVCGGLNDAMAHCGAGGRGGGAVSEREIEARVEFGCKMRGATRMAFPSVVASGRNGTVLHYMANECAAREGDFVMVDAGCQVHGLCSDVSRSWPVGGAFSAAQRALYELVLDVQLSCIDAARAGVALRGRPASVNALHDLACERLAQGLLDLGFMRGMSRDDALASGAYARWFSHSLGHYLGYDVHDTHDLSKDIPLEPGMCITVEPGLYVRADDMTAPEPFRGIGMRVEDDLLVTPAGAPPEVLSREAVKHVADIEALVGSGDSAAHGGLAPPMPPPAAAVGRTAAM